MPRKPRTDWLGHLLGALALLIFLATAQTCMDATIDTAPPHWPNASGEPD